MDYKNYLNSEHWKNVRQNKHLCNNFLGKDCCSICGSREKLEIHHLTYKNLGNENNKTLRIVCHRCHSILSNLPKLIGTGRIVKKWLRLRKQILEIIYR